MTKIVNKKSEILFCFDITDANPNGDPSDNNKPRIDEETKVNIVTDVRLKRTIRDFLYEYEGFNDYTKGKDIFIREIVYDEENQYIQTAKKRANDFEKKLEKIIQTCIDIRLFGGVIPLEKDSITFTGPVQFRMGRSLHPVELTHIKGTGAFASVEKTKQKTFRGEYILPYSFIAFYGVINDKAAQQTNLTEEDVNLMLKAMWNGTKTLISRSKFGQMPRLLIKIDYKEESNSFFIGDLDKKIKITEVENMFKIRKVSDFKVEISELINSVSTYKDKIQGVSFLKDDYLKLNKEIPSEWKKIEF